MIAELLTPVGRWLLLCVLLLTGCQLYWTKPELHQYVAVTHFFDDHKQCVIVAGSPQGAERVYVNLDIYRACLQSKGWQRVNGPKTGVSLGMFRGQEDEGPVSVSEVPKQIPVLSAPTRYRRGDSGTNFGPR